MYNNTENKIVYAFFGFILMLIFIGTLSGCGSIMDRLNNSGRYDGLDGFGSEIVKHNEKNR